MTERASDIQDELFDDDWASEPIELPPWFQGGPDFGDQTPRVSRQRFWFEAAPTAVGDSHDEAGQLIWTPGQVNDYLRNTNTMFQMVNADYKKAVAEDKLPQQLRDNWNKFTTDWNAFYKDSKGSIWGGTVTRAEDYRKRLVEWRDRVAKYTQVTSPPVHVEPRSELEQSLTRMTTGMGIGALAAIAVGLWLMHKYRRP